MPEKKEKRKMLRIFICEDDGEDNTMEMEAKITCFDSSFSS